MFEKTVAYRERRANDTRRWRARRARGAAVYSIEVDGTTFDLLERFGGLRPEKVDDREAVSVALSRLLRRALVALERDAAQHQNR